MGRYIRIWQRRFKFERISRCLVYSLLVFPYSGILWAGTEIGLFESLDDGLSWHYADNGLPAVSIWQMDIIDLQLVVATHGRGIWTLDLTLVGMPEKPGADEPVFSCYPNPSRDYVNVSLEDAYKGPVEIMVTDMNGRAIIRTERFKSDATWQMVLDIQNLKAANYMITVKYGSKLATDKITVY